MRRIVLLVLSLAALLAFSLSAENNFGEDSFELDLYYDVFEQYGLEPNVLVANSLLIELLPDETSNSEIEDLIEQLSSARYAQREAAEEALITRGTKALGLLANAVESGDTETRMRSQRCIAAIQNGFGNIVHAAIQIFRLDPAASLSSRQRLETLCKVSEHLNGLGAGTEMALAIQDLADSKVKDVILSGLKTENRQLRLAFISALPKCFSQSELKQFGNLIVDADEEVSLVAIEAFGESTPDVSIKRLVNVLIRSDALDIRRRSLELLRGLSRNYFGVQAIESPNTQVAAIKKWDDWLKANQIFDARIFKDYRKSSQFSPIGFLVSNNGSALTEFDVHGNEKWKLNLPVYDARICVGDRILVTERNLNQVRLIDRKGRTIQKITNLNSPADAELLPNNHVIVMQGNGVVSEHDSFGKEVNRIEGAMKTPFDVDRLRNGNTLVADSGNDRIAEFNAKGELVWEKTGLAFPNNVFRLRDGRTLYTTYTSGLVGLLTPEGENVWEVDIENSTLYSVHYAAGKIFVADGRNKRVVVLNMGGQQVKEIPLKVGSFCDISFVTRSAK